MAPLSFFGILRQNGCWKIPKVPPLSFFRNCETFFKNFFHQKCPSFNLFWWFATEWTKNFKVFPLVPQFGSTFGFFRDRRREDFDTLMSFRCFRVLDIASTWAVPGLFSLVLNSGSLGKMWYMLRLEVSWICHFLFWLVFGIVVVSVCCVSGNL